MNEWQAHFNDALQSYSDALLSGAIPSNAERAASAKAFRAWIDHFKSGGQAARQILEIEMRSENYNRATTAARLFIECSDTDSLAQLSQDVSMFRGKISWPDLKRLWIKVPPPESLYDEFTQTSAYELHPLQQALLSQPTPEAYKLFQEIWDKGWRGGLAPAIDSIAKWGDLILLNQFMTANITDDIRLDRWGEDDFRTDAAFYLGLNGNQDGIDFLKKKADSDNLKQAVDACRYLAQLALPDAIEPTLRLLKSEDGDIVAHAANYAADLCLPMFIPALCNVAQRKMTSSLYDNETPLYDEAIRAAREIIGKPLADLEEEYYEPSAEEEFYGEGEFTEAFRQQAVAISHSAMKSMNIMSRYYEGELLTLEHLASDLLSPHSGPQQRAAHNLRAITGEDYGFDLDDDVIANLPAIEAWQQRAKQPDPLVPGGWAYWGKSLPDPQTPNF